MESVKERESKNETIFFLNLFLYSIIVLSSKAVKRPNIVPIFAGSLLTGTNSQVLAAEAGEEG